MTAPAKNKTLKHIGLQGHFQNSNAQSGTTIRTVSSPIQTLLSVAEFHCVVFVPFGKNSRTVTAGREFHPALKMGGIWGNPMDRASEFMYESPAIWRIPFWSS
jgi:hypothetical protein